MNHRVLGAAIAILVITGGIAVYVYDNQVLLFAPRVKINFEYSLATTSQVQYGTGYNGSAFVVHVYPPTLDTYLGARTNFVIGLSNPDSIAHTAIIYVNSTQLSVSEVSPSNIFDSNGVMSLTEGHAINITVSADVVRSTTNPVIITIWVADCHVPQPIVVCEAGSCSGCEVLPPNPSAFGTAL
jgi:hypothetical protein